MTSKVEKVEEFNTVGDLCLTENSVDINSLIDRLKLLLSEKYKNLRVPSSSKEILEICLRRKQFNLDEAADQVNAFLKLVYDIHGAQKDMYFLPSIHKEYHYDTFGMVVLKQRDAKGRAVIWTDFGALKTQEFCLEKSMACGIMILNELTRTSLEIQKNGIVYVYNMKGFQFGHAKNFNFRRVRMISRYVQGAIPVSFKAFHMVNSPAIFGCIYSLLIKPLLRSKIRSRVHFHSTDLSNFYEDVNREILPDVVGGDLPLKECTDLEFTNYLCSQDSYYKELLQSPEGVDSSTQCK